MSTEAFIIACALFGSAILVAAGLYEVAEAIREKKR